MMLDILLNAAVRMLLVGAAAWLALRIIRVRNPHTEVLAWRMLLLAGLALPALLYWRLAPSFVTSFELPVISAAGTGATDASAASIAVSMVPTGVLLSIYLAVALLLLGRFAAGFWGMWRLSRAASRMAMSGDVRRSARVRSPATFGAIILLPAEAHTWPAEKLDVVLAHERAHVRSRDGYWSWLAQLHTAIFWFSPSAWWLQRRLETLAETTSDDAVVAARHDPVAYAALLLDFARHPNSRSVVMSVAESNVPERIERLLARVPPAHALPRVARYMGLALLVPVVVFAASTTRATPPAEPASPPAPAVHAPVLVRDGSVRLTRAADPDSYYPAIAKHEKVSGYAMIEVDVDVFGEVVDARVLEVQPADPRFGFADAALQVAYNSTFTNLNTHVSKMRFKVKFALSE